MPKSEKNLKIFGFSQNVSLHRVWDGVCENLNIAQNVAITQGRVVGFWPPSQNFDTGEPRIWKYISIGNKFSH